MRTRALVLAALAAAVLVAAGCGGSSGGSSSSGSGSSGGNVVKGGILRVGTINYIDSLNPFNYIETQSTNAFIMIYPQLVQYKFEGGKYSIEGDWAKSWTTSPDGKTWTFTVHTGKWSDGKPLTAADGAWTINTTVKYASDATAVAAAALLHVKDATAPNPTTLVIHYSKPVANVLPQLETLSILPEHFWKKFAVGNGRGLKTYHPEQHLPVVTGGAYTIKQYEKKGTTVFLKDPNFYGPPSNADAVALTYYTNADAMIADLKQGNLDWVDQVPFSAVNVVKKDTSMSVHTVPGAETTNITWNSNPLKPKNRELLNPQVKKALSMCVDRDKIINVVFSGYAEKVESLVGHIAIDENPNLGPLQYDCAAGNQALDQLGYKKGADGIRVVPATTGKYAQPAHKMQYDIMVPSSLDFNGNREFDIIQQGFAQAGVKVTEQAGGDSSAAYAIETDTNCDASKLTGYDKYDMALWDWVGYIDPDFMLSVVTRSQWCSWSDTGWYNPAYDKLYDEQGTAVDPAKRKQIVYRMQQMIYDNVLYTQLVEEQFIDASSKKWSVPSPALNAYAKTYYTAAHKVG